VAHPAYSSEDRNWSIRVGGIGLPLRQLHSRVSAMLTQLRPVAMT
jgi:hypothetical protein